jgi:metal-responsive CopG/Arc/MetJ family transcriptional regulator
VKIEWANIVPMRLHVVLDEDVVKEIDSYVGKRGRSKFVREAVETKLEEDTRRRAAIERLWGSMPDLAPSLAETLREEGHRETEDFDRKIEAHWRRPLD